MYHLGGSRIVRAPYTLNIDIAFFFKIIRNQSITIQQNKATHIVQLGRVIDTIDKQTSDTRTYKSNAVKCGEVSQTNVCHVNDAEEFITVDIDP